jgi:hemolysin activation/secretion protein
MPPLARLALRVALLCQSLAGAACAQGAESVRFDLLEFDVEGNTVLAVPAIERAVSPFLGPGRSMGDVEAARAALERAYQQSGFLTVFVDVPEQRVEGGVVRLQVTQGRLDRLRVVGSRYFSQGVIRETVAELEEGKTPDFNRVQQQLAELNRTEDRRVQPVLRPGRTPGTVDVDLQVSDRLPAEASLELNNRHPANTSDLRLSATARYNNLWQRGHSIGLTLTTAPQAPSQSRQVLLTYAAPLAADATLSAFLAGSDSLVEPLGAVTVAGKGIDFGLRYMRPLPPVPALPDFVHSLTLGVDYKDFKTNTVTGEVGVLTPLRYLPMQLGYAADWQHERAHSSLNTQFVFALREVLGRSVNCADAGTVDQFDCSAKDADGSFAYWRGELRHSLQTVSRSTLNLRLGWQLSLDPLVSNERYAVGGVDTVRGYLDAEAQGDRALVGSLEWRTRNLAAGADGAHGPGGSGAGGAGGPGWLGALDEATAYAFAEAAQVNVLNALPEQPVHVQLRGVGLGLQWRAGKSLSGNLDLAWPLVRTVDTPSRDPRLHFRLSLSL